MTFEERIQSMVVWDMDPALYSSLLAMLVVLAIAIAIGVLARRAIKKETYLERPKGLLFLAETAVQWFLDFTKSNMDGERESWAGYLMCVAMYLLVGFNISLFGLPGVIDWMGAPLSLALIMFALIQYQGLKNMKLKYFHRYVEPIAIFLPVNLITMWSPIISTTMRLLGNALAGTVIIGLVQWALGNMSGAIFDLFGGLTQNALIHYVPWWDVSHDYVWTQIFLAPFAMGTLNLYFALFSSAIQTLVFISLNAVWISQELPPAEEERELTRGPRVSYQNS